MSKTNCAFQKSICQAQPNSVLYGRVESIEPVNKQQEVPGLLGTVIGAVARNQIERRTGTQTVYRVNVRLADGRLATVHAAEFG